MLSNDERREQWQKILNGETKIVVGARSAIFAPFKNLKLIIVDEEHETSYKQSESPTYNGRDVAVYRAFLENCPVILGSATPTIESFYNAENQKYELLKLTKRANENAKIPKVKICDIKSEIANYDKSLFSSELKKNIDQALINKQQIILFLNRRGFSPVMICLSCGAEFKCPDCNVALTFHYNEQKAICHYCGYEIFVEGKCPECHQNTLKFIGSGTEKIELASKYNFPDAIVKRVDADTVRKKNYLNDVLTKFKNKDIDILVGTQILAKGLDFPEVTVVGVILADITLNLPDFRAAERTFSLLTQVAGRAGRSIFQGNVVIQTLKPKNYAIQSSVTQDYIKFYNYEISLRKKYGYPPFNKLINIVFSGETENEVKYFSKLLVESLTKYKSNLKILGPVPAAIPYLRKKYRYHILIKGNKLLFFKRLILEFFKNMNSKKTKMFIDVDPISIM
jgi:primosomal protein N' (replication factor Y)